MPRDWIDVVSAPGMLATLRVLANSPQGTSIHALHRRSGLSYSGTYAIVQKLIRADMVDHTRSSTAVTVRLRKPLPTWIAPRVPPRAKPLPILLPGLYFQEQFGLMGIGDLRIFPLGSRLSAGPTRAVKFDLREWDKVSLARVLLLVQGSRVAEFVERARFNEQELSALRKAIHEDGLFKRARYFGLARQIDLRPPRIKRTRRTRSDAQPGRGHRFYKRDRRG